jgi:hypothetical protein
MPKTVTDVEELRELRANATESAHRQFLRSGSHAVRSLPCANSIRLPQWFPARTTLQLMPCVIHREL